MDTFCRKYREPVPQEGTEKGVECRHPRDYCTFRSSCIVYFLSREDKDGRPEGDETPDAPG